MASYTPNLNLLMKDPVTDGADTFNIETMLNENWEKIDAAVLRAIAAAAAYDAGKTYQQGDFCTQGGLLYRANQVIAQPEAWTAGHWTAISITDVIRGLTAADVGAAPDGFGLGIDYGGNVPGGDINNATKNGWYSLAGTELNAPTVDDGVQSVTGAMLFVQSSRSDRSKVQWMTIGNAGFFGYTLRRYYNPTSTEWSSWEWLNPPMQTGVEYRTTERRNGMPVYAMYFACGTMTNGAQIDYPLQNGNQVDFLVRGIAYGSTSCPLPQIFDKSLNDVWTAYARFDRRSMYFFCGDSATGNNCSAIIYYTKMEDRSS